MGDKIWTVFVTVAVMIAIFFTVMVIWRAGQIEALSGQAHYEPSNGYYVKAVAPINIIRREREE